MGFFGALSVLLSGFLVINTINALLGQHIRQIGVMKAVGARTGQLVAMYLALVFCFGLLSLAISLPLAGYAAHIVAAGTAAYLNFNSGPFRIPTVTIVLQAIVAILIPLGAALAPVFKGARITIREAISSYGLGRGTFGKGLVDRLVEHIRGLPRPLLISIRNTFRRKARLILTLSALILAGAIFIAVFNLKASMDTAIKQTLGYVLSDVNVNFNQWYRMQKIEPIARAIPGVVDAEGWGLANAEVLTADKTAATQVLLFAPPANSTLITPTMTSGRWLLPGDQNAVVIGNHMVAARPELKVGDVITINIEGKKNDWHIVGIYRMAGNVVPPILYANYDYLGIVMGRINQVFSLRVTTSQHDLLSQQRVADQLEAAYTAAGIQVSNTSTGATAIAQNKQTTDILVYFLLVMAVLIAVVGGLGLTSTMSMNVIERTREIGVMRAIGASNRSVQSIVIVEGMMIGIISWILGALLAIPIGILMANVVGRLFLQSPMDFIFSMDGFMTWLVIVLILSALASFLPARNASRLTVREVLAYE
jgi:putative ABC transport system permease protein